MCDSLWLYPPALSTEGTGKNVHLSVIPWKGLDCTLYKLVPEGQLLIRTHLVAGYHLPRSLKDRGDTSPTFSLWLAPTIKPSLCLLPGRSLSTHPAPQILWLSPEGWVLKSLSSDSQQSSVFQAHGTILNYSNNNNNKNSFQMGAQSFPTGKVSEQTYKWQIGT